MSKAIKVRDHIYTKLDDMRGKGETFSDVISVLLKVYETIKTTSDILGPSHFLKGKSPPVVRGLTETVFYNPEKD